MNVQNLPNLSTTPDPRLIQQMQENLQTVSELSEIILEGQNELIEKEMKTEFIETHLLNQVDEYA